LAGQGWQVDAVAGTAPAERRLLLRTEPGVPSPEADDPRLARPPFHERATPASGLRDELAESGLRLFQLAWEDRNGMPSLHVELPMFERVDIFLAVLGCLARASSGLPVPRLTGFPPPVDASVAWTTITPDPAVIEINTAPSRNAREFLARSRAIYATATEQGLAPYRLYYNGTVADSGGAGQITLGGPAPDASPFLVEARLMPRLVRFFNRHPALTYLYSHEHVGAGGQAVRADERGLDAFDELRLALTLLEREPAPSAERIWHGLASFLCDASGNSHRAEMNIEKLWNPFLGSRGQQGLVEFRSLRMQHTPERATALACLLRAIVAMLARSPYDAPLVDWGRELHGRFALPFYLEQDLEAVLSALDEAGLGFSDPIREQLRKDEFRYLGRAELPGCILEVRRALEFWPLLGDASSPEQGGSSRLVDASTSRVELRLRPAPDGEMYWDGWQMSVSDVGLSPRLERDRNGELKVWGLRYRSFVPTWGLHPSLGSQTPVRILLRHTGLHQAFLVTLHEWRPTGGGYTGLPQVLEEAAARRAERITLEPLAWDAGLAPEPGSADAPGTFCTDLRYLKQ
jgi:uncharacterized protein (DUF2126 family)